MDSLNNVVTVEEAAKIFGKTRQGIHYWIKRGKVKTKRLGKKLLVKVQDLQEFEANRYSRKGYGRDGFFSSRQVCEKLGITQQRIYYLCNIGVVFPVKRGRQMFFNEEACEKIRKYLEEKKISAVDANAISKKSL